MYDRWAQRHTDPVLSGNGSVWTTTSTGHQRPVIGSPQTNACNVIPVNINPKKSTNNGCLFSKHLETDCQNGPFHSIWHWVCPILSGTKTFLGLQHGSGCLTDQLVWFPGDIFTKIQQNLQFYRHLLGRVTNPWNHTDPVYPSNISVKGHLPAIDSHNIN